MSFRAHRLFATLVRQIEKAAGCRSSGSALTVSGPRGGRFHIHALIATSLSCGGCTGSIGGTKWQAMHASCRLIRAGGAAYYCAKYVAKEINDWDLSDNLRAFADYQPVLPLEGGSELAQLLPPKSSESGMRVRPKERQFPMPYALRVFALRRMTAFHPFTNLGDAWAREVSRLRFPLKSRQSDSRSNVYAT